jgi:uncharacterized coiled-coil protein SlyX
VALVEERLAFMEGRVVEHAQMFSDIRDGMAGLGQRMDRLDERMDRFEERMERRFEQVDARFVQIDARFVQMDGRFLRIDTRLDQLGGELSKHFRWLVGVQITTTFMIVATLIGVLAGR